MNLQNGLENVRGCNEWNTFFEEKIKKENGFAIVDYQLKFYGYCADCERNDKTDK